MATRISLRITLRMTLVGGGAADQDQEWGCWALDSPWPTIPGVGAPRDEQGGLPTALGLPGVTTRCGQCPL